MKQTVNPYLPSYEYMPDGEPHVFGDRIYVFGSHDKFGGKEFCENDYTCWSAPVDDLSDWRCEGIIYKRSQDPTPVAPVQHYMWAPDVCQGPDGRYYLYYGLEFYNRIGVAVCDTPCGKYEFYGDVHYKDGTRYGGLPQERLRFDPGVINDNGRIYLYTGFSLEDADWLKQLKNVYTNDYGNDVVELDKDMLTVISTPKTLLPGIGNSKGTGFEGHEFYEASSMRKFSGKYYAVYSSVLSHELAYAVSDYPDRDFVFGGSLYSNGFDKDDKLVNYWGNNHGSIEKINGKYYIFGHRQTNKNECTRQGIAEPIEFKDGKFMFAEMTSMGPMGKPLSCKCEYEAGIACVLMSKNGACKTTNVPEQGHPFITQDGEDREDSPAQYISNFCDGCVAGYKYFDLGKSTDCTLTIRGTNGKNAEGVVEIADNESFHNASKIKISINEKTDISALINTCGGKKPLYIRYSGVGSIDILKIKLS